ncbi:MAG TPA: peptidylprolyl isomerase [Alphaproteobacteria bacterium]|nr:peptidylprolyl isomerase [Alphaproteobacteria bacterium]
MRDHSGPVFTIGKAVLKGAAVLGALALFAAVPALAQDAPAAAAPAAVSPDTVVATVGGETITEADIAFAAEDLQQELQQMAPADRKPFLVTVLIDMKVMAKAARDEQMDQTDIFKRRLRYLEERALRRAFFSEKIAADVTPEAVQAAYDAFVQTFVPQEEVHARHILVGTKEDAEAIRAELATGKPFEVLAMEKSTDPSAKQNGGDLGFFQRGQMVKPFEDAAFALQPGEVSEPIETQFGWHIIKLEEKRQSKPPALEEIEGQLQQQVMFQAFENTVGKLKEGLTIDIPDAALAEGVKRQAEGQPASGQ